MGFFGGARLDLAWRTTETNHFGTDEFMKWCEIVGTEPYLCLNFGTGQFDMGAPFGNRETRMLIMLIVWTRHS
jgi:alpha-L-arabinofuranosidase